MVQTKITGMTSLFLLVLLIVSVILFVVPAQANTTVGRPTGTVPYRTRDFNPHVPGPVGYVWPGAGVVSLSTGSGAPSPVTWAQGPDLPPGYQSPWSTNPPGAQDSWYQLAGNTYAPFGAILTSTSDHPNIGDLVFGISFSTGQAGELPTATTNYLYHSLTIYIPPEFTPPIDWSVADTSNIVTTITNNYDSIYVWKADVKDPFGPGWWVIYINPYLPLERDASKGAQYGRNPRGILFSLDNGFNEWYFVRVNGMTAPKIAGRYIFKMFLSDNIPTMNSADGNGNLQSLVLGTMPTENWPDLLVKGEVDPCIIEGTIYSGAWNQQLYNLPIQLPGRVRAVGVADDPYTGASTGRPVEARGFFNGSARGHYEVEGVAPGVYDVYASAAGYPETKVASSVKLPPGKSFHLDFLLNPGPIISGVIYSKHAFGETGWPSIRPVTVEIYDSNNWPSGKPGYDWDSKGKEWEAAHLKSFSPINMTDAPFTSYVDGNVIYDPGTGYTKFLPPNTPKRVAFPWEHDVVGLPSISWVRSVATTAPKDPFGLFNGVGPAQYWWVDPSGTYTNGGGSNGFRFQFGVKSFYGAPIEFDGHVPQVYATWVNGLTAGKYYLRSWINGYVQTDISGSYMDYPFEVAAEEWAGDINTPMHLETSSWINKTVYFHDLPGSLQTSPIRGPDNWRYLIAEAYDGNNVLVAMNFEQVPVVDRYDNLVSSWNITLNGFGMEGPVYIGSGNMGGYPGVPAGMRFFLYMYRHIRDYGIMPGSYTIRVYMRGYVQQEFELASISLSQSPAQISNHMYRGAGVNVTLGSVDWQHPKVSRYWKFPGDDVRVYVYNSQTGLNMGCVRYFDKGQNKWDIPSQTGASTIPSVDWQSSKLKFNGTLELERYGPDTEGWLTGGANYYDDNPSFGVSHVAWGLDGSGKTVAQTGLWLEFGFDRYGFLASPSRYRTKDLKTKVALETGMYELKAYTLGYVQSVVTVYTGKGQQTDTRIDLTIGVNITVNIEFRKEGMFTQVPYNSSVRIQVWNQNNELSAVWCSSVYDRSSFYDGVIRNGIIAYGGYGTGPEARTGEARNWVMKGVNQLQVQLVGNYVYSGNDPELPSDYRWKWCGIDQGSYRIEVDLVNMYHSDRSFPTPPGLLLGDNYHIIDGIEGPYNGRLRFNHLGPWEQKTSATVLHTRLGQEASVVLGLDQRGLVSGNIAGFTWSDELRPISWVSITASGAVGRFTSYSWDGYYDMYLSTGPYEFTISEWSPTNAGHNITSASLTVSTGQTVTGFSFYLERSKIPIPEFPVAVISLVSAVSVSLCILRRSWRSFR